MRIAAYRPIGASGTRGSPAGVSEAADAWSADPVVGFILSDGPGDPGRIVPLEALADERLGRVALGARIAGLDLRRLLRADPGLRRTEAALDAAVSGGAEPPGHGLDEVRLCAPIPEPGKVVCVGQNYAAHVREQNAAMPDRPMLFAKFANAVIGDGDPVIRHAGTHALDLEAELAVVVGRRMRGIRPAEALAHVAGYTVANDISARDLQGSKPALAEGEHGDGQWLRAKGSDTFCPLGPAIVTPSEIPDPGDLALRSWRVPVTGPGAGTPVPMQDARTDDMIFDVAHLLSFISHAITLEPGDVVLTGTPSGVGVFRNPPVFLEPGDIAVVEVERIGRLSNPIVAADGSAPAESPAARLLARERAAIA